MGRQMSRFSPSGRRASSATTASAGSCSISTCLIRRLTADHPAHKSIVSLTAVYHNLLRQWAEV
jgi:hypothetical protein